MAGAPVGRMSPCASVSVSFSQTHRDTVLGHVPRMCPKLCPCDNFGHIRTISICSKDSEGGTSSRNPSSLPWTELIGPLTSSIGPVPPFEEHLSHSTDMVCFPACPASTGKLLEDRDQVSLSQHPAPSTQTIWNLCVAWAGLASGTPSKMSRLQRPHPTMPTTPSGMQGKLNLIHPLGFSLGITTPRPPSGPGEACSDPEHGDSPG